MSPAFAYAPAASPWLRDAPPAWRFARVVERGAALPQMEWLLKRNCSMSPKQVFGLYLSICVLSLGIALGFTWHGAAPVLAFAGFEMLCVGMAFMVYARHAADCEHITLADGALVVTHRRGSHTARTDFRAAWVRVEPRSADRSLVALSGDGREAHVGRYIRPEWRAALAQELRSALRLQPPVLALHSQPPVFEAQE
jgi:uncharacterized membrane protein